MSTPAIIRHRRDTAANWTSNNPVLEAGQLGLETDTLKIKFGDGTTAWNSLSYASGGGGGGVTDGDKGDITVSSSGATWTIDNGAVTYAKMQDVSAASKLIGRGSASGSGDPQEITIGTNLTMSGTTLSAAGSISGSTGSTDNAIIRADGTGGSTIQGSVPTIDDNGKILADAFALDTTPTTTGGTGVIIWDSTESAPSVGFNANVLGKLGVDQHVQVYNQTGSTIAKRKVVRQSGSSGTRLKVDLALADGDPNSATTIGITAESISNNSSGFIITAGLLTGVNTIAFTEGDVLWLSSTSSGDITNVRPTQPNHGVRLGYCIKSSAGAGIIYVDVLNGFELEELHDVLLSSPVDNSFLVYESSSSLWKNEAPSAARTSLGLGTLATQNGTFSGTSSGTNTGDQTITLTGDVTGSGTGSFAATIAAGAVSTSKLGGDITTAGKALLDDADAAAQRTTLGLGTLATQSGTFSGTSSGTNTGDQTISLTGDVTGSGTGSFAATIASSAVTNAKMANMTASTIKARVTGSTGAPEDATLTQVLDLVGSAAQGDILYRGASTWTRLGAGTSGQYLQTQGAAANPQWATVSASGGGTKTYADFTPLNNQPPSTAFATLDTRNSVAVLDFDDGATNEASIFVSVLPEAAVVSSGLKVRIHWMATSATSGNCRWGAQFADLSDQDIDSYAFDTATEVSTATSGTSGNVTVTEITCTSIDSITAGKPYAIKVYRDSSDTTNDTMTGDAELIAVEVRSAA